MSVQFQVLGPLRVHRADTLVPVSAAKHRVLLASLLLQANRTVRTSTLVDHLWADNPPARAANTVQAYIARLRRALGPGVIRTETNGYLAAVSPDQLDLCRFERLLDQARSAADLSAESALLHEAESLWRGPLLTNVPSERIHSVDVPALTEQQVHTVAWRIDVDIRLGRHAELVGELRGLTAQYPLREKFWQQLMLVLYRSGRQVEALDAHRSVSTLLDKELGLQPGAEIQALQRAILNQDPSLSVPGAVHVDGPQPCDSGWSVQRQLPAEIRWFAGRTEQIREISAVLGDEREHGVPVVVVSGSPGVGKSALATHVSHRVAEHYPDGVWYATLGVERSATSVTVDLLRASGMDCATLPSGEHVLSAMLRSRLAGRRVLLVFDDARDVEQVLPLLPGTPGNAVLITSRHRLSELVATHGAHCHVLEVLSPLEAVSLLDTMLAEWRAASADLAELAALCGFLPLALRIAAANILGGSAGSVAEYNAELRVGNRLNRLGVGADDYTVRAAFDLSYRRLRPQAAGLFRLLGLLPGGAGSVAAATALLGEDRRTVLGLLRCLTAANLLHSPTPDRFQFHDLLRLYAVERGLAEDSPLTRAAARRRLYRHYAAEWNTAGRQEAECVCC